MGKSPLTNGQEYISLEFYVLTPPQAEASLHCNGQKPLINGQSQIHSNWRSLSLQWVTTSLYELKATLFNGQKSNNLFHCSPIYSVNSLNLYRIRSPTQFRNNTKIRVLLIPLKLGKDLSLNPIRILSHNSNTFLHRSSLTNGH